MTHINFDAAPAIRAAAILKHGFDSRQTIPVLSYMRIAPVRVGMRLTVTDLDKEVSTVVEGSWTGPRKPFLIPFRAFLAAVGADKTSAIALAFDAANSMATLSFGGITAKLKCLCDVADFPMMTVADGPRENVSMSEPDLYRHFKVIRHCVSKEETRYYLNGIAMMPHPERATLRTVCTDGHRLGIYDTETKWPVNAHGIFPTSLVDAVLTCVQPDGNRDVTLSIDPDHLTRVRIVVGDVTIKAKLIDGTFPDYTRVLPRHTVPFRVNVTALGVRRPIRIAQALGGDRTPGTKLDAREGRGLITCVDGGDVSFPIEVAAFGQKGNGIIGFNGNYLVDQGRATPTFQLAYEDSASPAEITCEDPNAFFVLMPMRV